MLAVLMAIRYGKSCTNKLQIITDSQYVIQGLKGKVEKWERNNWIVSVGSIALNIDLWKALVKEKKDVSVSMIWVKGHSGNLYNEKVDKMALKARVSTSREG